MDRGAILQSLRDGNARYVRERGTELVGGVPGVVPAHRPVQAQAESAAAG